MMYFATIVAVAIAFAPFIAANQVADDLVFISSTRHLIASNGTELAVVRDGIVVGTDLAVPVSDASAFTAFIQTIPTALSIGAGIACALPNPASPVACVTAGVIAVLGSFLAAWLGRRDLDELDIIVNTDYPAIAGCGTMCRLKFEAEEGPWRSIGNVTVHGIFHDLHYQRFGDFSGLRSIQRGPVEQVLNKRQTLHSTETREGTGVVDYYFIDENHAAFNAFQGTSALIQQLASTVTGDMVSAGTTGACFDFKDSVGIVNAGFIGVGGNGQSLNLNALGGALGITQKCYAAAQSS